MCRTTTGDAALRAQRVALALVAVVFVALVGSVVYATATDDAPQPSDAPAASSTSVVTPDGEVEPTPPSGSVGRLIAGFVLIFGWAIGVTVTILRAVHRRRAGSAAAGIAQ